MAENITPRSVNYSDWYIDIVTKAKLADYSPVRGCMVIRPRGYAIWEKMQSALDRMFKETGHENAYFPLLIPEDFMRKEAEHVEGFAPELAVVTHGGGQKLENPFVIRPTSETIIWSMYKKWIQSYRDLPLLINQWANVMRWEKRTRLFLRTSEFLWQEGHTAHATEEEAMEETLRMLDIYRTFAEEFMALPVLTGMKSENEKFAGAVSTYAIEALMQDGRALQAGTSHFLGQNFAKAFDVSFQNKDGRLEHVWATSWGVSTRLIGALIMGHSDDKGLILPPKLAPTQVVIIPIFRNKNKTEIMAYSQHIFSEIHAALGKEPRAIIMDDDDQNSPGWKFAEYEMQGIPLRIEIGARELESKTLVAARRDTSEKISMSGAEVSERLPALLEDIQTNLFQRAAAFRDTHTTEVSDSREFYELFAGDGGTGFVVAPWNGNPEIEEHIKQKTRATIRVLLEPAPNVAGAVDEAGIARAEGAEGTAISETRCIFSGEPAKYRAVFARAY